MLLGVINPKIIDAFEKPDIEQVFEAQPAPDHDSADEKERLMKSIKKYQQMKKKEADFDDVALNPDDDNPGGIDVGTNPGS